MLDSRKAIGFAVGAIDRIAATHTLRNYELIRVLVSVGALDRAQAEFDAHAQKTTSEAILDAEIEVGYFGVSQGLLGGTIKGLVTALSLLGLQSINFKGQPQTCGHCKLREKIDFEGQSRCITRGCFDREPGHGERVDVVETPQGEFSR